MPGIPATHLQGLDGEIVIPLLDAHIATIASWKLDMRRSDDGSGSGLFDLSAVLSWANMHLWDDPDYEKEIILSLGRGSLRYKLQQTDWKPILDWSRRSLRMEGVRLCPAR